MKFCQNCWNFVSLFTREWIEIPGDYQDNPEVVPSPSLRGSGLKSTDFATEILGEKVSLFTREWIEIDWLINKRLGFFSLPLYEGVD